MDPLGRKTHAALNVGQGKPISALERKVDGPTGQPAGTYTTDPKELDGILQEARKMIFEGNVENFDQLIDGFKLKYGKHIFRRANAFKLDKLVGADLKFSCIHGKKSANGMDQWAPADLS